MRKQKNLFLIDPNNSESQINRNYLNTLGIPLEQEYQYIAPVYDRDEISDIKLFDILENLVHRPEFILINLGGGVQERLGSYLKNNLSYNPGIICTGAAIAFLTGSQAKIPKWVDEFYAHGEYANKPFFEALEFAFRFQQAAGSTLLEKFEDLQFKKIKPKDN